MSPIGNDGRRGWIAADGPTHRRMLARFVVRQWVPLVRTDQLAMVLAGLARHLVEYLIQDRHWPEMRPSVRAGTLFRGQPGGVVPAARERSVHLDLVELRFPADPAPIDGGSAGGLLATGQRDGQSVGGDHAAEPEGVGPDRTGAVCPWGLFARQAVAISALVGDRADRVCAGGLDRTPLSVSRSAPRVSRTVGPSAGGRGGVVAGPARGAGRGGRARRDAAGLFIAPPTRSPRGCPGSPFRREEDEPRRGSRALADRREACGTEGTNRDRPTW